MKATGELAVVKILRWFRQGSRNSWLTLCFLAYIAFLFVFGGLYYLVYVSDGYAFSFSSDIAHTQEVTFRNSAEADIDVLRNRLAFWAKVDHSCFGHPYIAEGSEGWKVPDGRITCADGLALKFRSTRRLDDNALPVPEWDMVLFDARHGEIGRERLLPRFTPSAATLERVGDISRSDLNRELNDRKADLATARVWSYWDFLYFSTITQTTVGYGDILPNRTLVRMIVVAQIIAGYAVIVLMFNVVFRHRRTTLDQT